MQRVLFLTACAAVFTLLQAMPPQLHAEDAPSLNGVWKAEKGEISGRKLPAGLVAKMKLTLRNGGYQFESITLADEGTYATNTSKAPHWIDITSAKGPNKGKVTAGVYELQGDTLRICYQLEGIVRPAGFATNPENAQLTLTYKRVK